MGIPPFKQITGAAGELADELTANNLLRRQIKNSPNVSITSHFSLISRLPNIIAHFKEVQLQKFGFRSAPWRRSFPFCLIHLIKRSQKSEEPMSALGVSKRNAACRSVLHAVLPPDKPWESETQCFSPTPVH